MYGMINYGWGLRDKAKKKEEEVPTCCIVFCTKCGCCYSKGTCESHGDKFVEMLKK